ncbi:sulfoxide reductase heme-binding subunit YedZ [Salinihabitans flavidus]|uniref:Protein-methionine-sulfoxide reductase heme-binding subunit MsrQ n=1 Tax=Salinihabitans flavidus TaxID=569882 RepID=A0A1H8RWC6_9RHOB|nr:protein-methionine-sulfoxide reductase heme-binding subunit MsrQ [Salinihabitans flavidus]SEO70606.1 sulfoxide reductase heme-binding subunit YedZ [Salinihabitans flavidus]
MLRGVMRDRINGALRRVPAWPFYPLAALYPAWLFYRGLTGGLGVDPVKAMEHAMGEAALQLLVLGLAITPLRRFAGINLLKFRRALGLAAFFYVCVHLLVWLVLDVQIPAQIWADILKRPYITIGMAGFALLVPLAITSNNRSVRRLGPAGWRRLHRLTYAAAILGAVHFLMLVKGFQMEPILYLAAILALLGMRLAPKPQRKAA